MYRTSIGGGLLAIVVATVFVVEVVAAPVIAVVRVVLGLCPFRRLVAVYIGLE